MKEHQSNFSAKDSPSGSSAFENEASARKIIEDYLQQVKIRLPAEVAQEVISELRSHLLEQASQPKGVITTASAWEAVVSMGSPDLVAKEFRRDSGYGDFPELPASFIDALQPLYRIWFWRIVVLLVILDVVLIAYVISLAILDASMGFILFSRIIMLGILGQVWVFAGIGITYMILLLLSHPEGFPIREFLHQIFEQEGRKEERIPRTQKRVQKRVRRFEELTGRRHLLGELIGHAFGAGLAIIFALALLTLVPTYPSFEIQILIWLSIIALSHAGLTAIRVIVSDKSLILARIFASIDKLYALVTIYVLSLWFFGPLSWPLPLWNPATSTFILFEWKPFLWPLLWFGPIIILIIVVVMIVEIIEVNSYIQPLSNGTFKTTQCN